MKGQQIQVTGNWQRTLRNYLVTGGYASIVRGLVPDGKLPASWAILLGMEPPSGVERVRLLGAMMPKEDPAMPGLLLFMYQHGGYLEAVTNPMIWEIVAGAPSVLNSAKFSIYQRIEYLAYVYCSILAFIGTKWATEEDEAGVLQFLGIGKVYKKPMLPRPDPSGFASDSGPYVSPDDLPLSPIATGQDEEVPAQGSPEAWLAAGESPIHGGLAPQLMEEWGLSSDDLSWDQKQDRSPQGNRGRSPPTNNTGLPVPSSVFFDNKDIGAPIMRCDSCDYVR